MNISKICDALGNEVRYQIVKSLRSRSIATCCNRIEYYENGISVGDVVKAQGLRNQRYHSILSTSKAGIIYKEKEVMDLFFLYEEIINEFIKGLSMI